MFFYGQLCVCVCVCVYRKSQNDIKEESYRQLVQILAQIII